MIDTYKAGRRLKIHPGYREPGQLVPEAHAWFRKQEWVHAGHLKEVKVSEDEFAAAVAEFCPDLKDQVYELAGMDSDIVLQGPQKSPKKLDAPVALKGK